MSTLPAGFAKLILRFASALSKRVFQSVQVLLAGAIVAPWQTHGDLCSAHHGPEPGAPISDLPLGAQSRRMVESGGEPDFAATPGTRVRPRRAARLRAGRHYSSGAGARALPLAASTATRCAPLAAIS